MNALEQRAIAGTPYAMGRQLGEYGLEAVHAVLVHDPAWQAIQEKARQNAPLIARLAANTQRDFPAIWQELRGLADGLALPLDEVFAWNCRGELLATVADGCTSVQMPGGVLAHNEDGLPCLQGRCLWVTAQPQDEGAFSVFCYPGSLPGHTVGVCRGRFAFAVNNLRFANLAPMLPRIVVCRALLRVRSVKDAVALLERFNRCAGFHITLAERSGASMVSVEFGAGHTAVNTLSTPAVHANHALYHPGRQCITRSSADRQHRGEALLAQGVDNPLTILHDQSPEALPILRRALDDPDNENTLASVVITLGSAPTWHCYLPGEITPCQQGVW
ncbi:6-aminopenicillanic acid acyl-transferase [Halomonas alkaliantarctica]|nr:6-aminopenicillanic acid acyl-transferase [Halomonas alkaliantarctica]